MDIHINGRADIAEATPDTALGEVLEGIRRFAAEEGLVVEALRLDRAPLTAEQEAAWGGDPVARWDLLEVALAAPASAIRERLEEAATLLERGRRRAALQIVAAATGDLAALLACRGPGPDWLREGAEILRALQEALSAGDDVTVADLLRYEFAPRLEALEGPCSP